MADFFEATFQGFVNKDAVFNALDDKERIVLSRSGSYARSTMRRNMRRGRKRKDGTRNTNAGPVGGYPASHSGELKDKIFFNYAKREGAVHVGPIIFSHQPSWLPSGIRSIPELINAGGSVARTHRSVGGTGARIEKWRETRVVYNYRPRPYVSLTREKAAPKLLELYGSIPLRQKGHNPVSFKNSTSFKFR